MSTKQPDECLDCGAELEATARPRLAGDGVSLTLAGVIYGILITVAAVVIAPQSLTARLAFGAVTLAVLVAALAFAQPVIATMRWILKRATR